MSEVTEVPDVHALQKEIMEMKAGQRSIEQRVNVLERVSDRQDQQIMTLNEKLNKIEENTTWIKRTITGAIITAICTGIIGGAIAIFYTVLQK
ncbi:hemolysin XhlA family protein [Bacillus velezensis]